MFTNRPLFAYRLWLLACVLLAFLSGLYLGVGYPAGSAQLSITSFWPGESLEWTLKTGKKTAERSTNEFILGTKRFVRHLSAHGGVKLTRPAVYYNEFDPHCCEWLKNLMNAGLIPDGDLDSRSIKEVQPDDVRHYEQAHFFCGIGGWPWAFRLSGWGDRPAWTGSCPCQPYSAAGKRKGNDDERNLWPEFFRLIEACRPEVVFGEQVASSDTIGRSGGGGKRKPVRSTGEEPSEADRTVWIDGIQADLEKACYSFGAVDLPAACVGSPHIRQRLFWVGHTNREREGSLRGVSGRPRVERTGSTGRVGVAHPAGLEERDGEPGDDGEERETAERTGGDARRLADSRGSASERHAGGLHSSEGGIGGEGEFDGDHAIRSEHGRSVGGVDDSPSSRLQSTGFGAEGEARDETRLCGPEPRCTTRRLANAQIDGRRQRDAVGGRGIEGVRAEGDGFGLADDGSDSGLADSDGRESGDGGLQRGGEHGQQPQDGGLGFWDRFDLIPCRDGKKRRVEPGSFPLVDGIPFKLADGTPGHGSRAKALRGIGNAIVPPLTAEFIRAFMETTNAPR